MSESDSPPIPTGKRLQASKAQDTFESTSLTEESLDKSGRSMASSRTSTSRISGGFSNNEFRSKAHSDEEFAASKSSLEGDEPESSSLANSGTEIGLGEESASNDEYIRGAKRRKTGANKTKLRIAGSTSNVYKQRKLTLNGKLAEDIQLETDPYRDARWSLDVTERPLHDINEIFEDMTTKAMEAVHRINSKQVHLGSVVEHLGSRALRIATMCSGTESPLLALELVREALKEHHGMDFQIDHLFSAEIVPFKQAYIERNFHPKMIFRDVRELATNPEASTAYGAPQKVPEDVDILVAGFSCVDFSALNNQKKGLHGLGESGDTFHAVLAYALKYRPRIVVLENVCSAPWEQIQKIWEREGYATCHKRIDTKEYYIPQTRARGYMICIEHSGLGKTKAGEAAAAWKHLMKHFERRASSSIDAFLLNEDDPRVNIGRAQLVKGSLGEDKGPRDVDWIACQARYQDYRVKHQLGSGRTMTKWQKNGTCKFPDYAWGDWGKQQVERIWDTLEICLLRKAKKGYDAQYKTRIWELSQNVDRFEDTVPFGVTGCITPTGIPYVTNRGGPLIGLESISLQGLPIEKLILTRENQRQLRDLAGNAMTSTVVGSAILSALIVGHRALKKGPVTSECHISAPEPDLGKLDETYLRNACVAFAPIETVNVSNLLDLADRSIRLCYCEGRVALTQNPLSVCEECEHTICWKCGGTPIHKYHEYPKARQQSRLEPYVFADAIKLALPMRLELRGLDVKALEAAREQLMNEVGKAEWNHYIENIRPTFGEELRFHSTKRAHCWTVYYEALHSRLEVVFSKSQVCWHMYAKPDPREPVNSLTRKLLQPPFARMTPNSNTNLLDGPWEICLPFKRRIHITIEGKGQLVPSWESLLGLQDPEHKKKEIWNRLAVNVDLQREEIERLGLQISGEYKLLQDCGTASGSLHKRVSQKDAHNRPMYLFLDPQRIGTASGDHFVFSTDIHRLNYGETRMITARLNTWRPSSITGVQKSECTVNGEWIAFKGRLHAYTTDQASFKVAKEDIFQTSNLEIIEKPQNNLQLSQCAEASTAILSCKVRLKKVENIGWRKGSWRIVDQPNERLVYSALAWLTERISDLDGFSNQERELALHGLNEKCQVCAPARPDVKWRLDQEKQNFKLVPYEDARQAGEYERAIKARPTPFVTRIRIDEHDFGHLQIGLNILTLAHRALAKLGGDLDLKMRADVKVFWRLQTRYSWPLNVKLEKFTLLNNKNDPESSYNFATTENGVPLSLRPEQRRSLQWMIEQESEDAIPFYEQEVEESNLVPLGLRAAVRVTRPRKIRGGVIADTVGFGKTITTLALIDAQARKLGNAYLKPARKGLIPIKATLIVVPKHLVTQWGKEAEKFLGSQNKVIVVTTIANLAKLKIEDFRKADIVIVPWSMFENEAYLAKLSLLASLPEAPAAAGRSLNAWLKRATERLVEHTSELMKLDEAKKAGLAEKGGPPFRAFAQSLEHRLAAAKTDEELLAYIPSKRLRGKVYAANRDLPSTTNPEKSSGTEPLQGKKRKRDDSEAEEVKSRTVDTFGLQSAVSLDKIMTPMLQMFRFNRLVIDEYTYVDAKNYALLTSIDAISRWVLSGTPHKEDFADVKIMAGFLGVNLGIDSDADGIIKKANLNAMRKDRTDAEQFQSYVHERSPAWHMERQAHAQGFLNQFVRQNTVDMDATPFTETFVTASLPAAERASYLELQQQLQGQDMKIRKGSKARMDSDRSQRVIELLGSSQSPNEALLKRCSYFVAAEGGNLEGSNGEDLDKIIISIRTRQCADLVKEIAKKLRHAAWLHDGLKRPPDGQPADQHYRNWKRDVRENVFGDVEVAKALDNMIEDAEQNVSPKHEDEFYRTKATLAQLSEEKERRDTILKDKKTYEKQLKDMKLLAKKEAQKEAVQAKKTMLAASKSPNSRVESGRQRKKAKKHSTSRETSADDESEDISILQEICEAEESCEAKEKRIRDKIDEANGNLRSLELETSKPNLIDRKDFKEKVKALRILAKHLHALTDEYTSRLRALRFFKAVRTTQLWQASLRTKGPLTSPPKKDVPKCDGCQSEKLPSQMSVLGVCGHLSCATCLSSSARNGQCVASGCKAIANDYHAIGALELDQKDAAPRSGTRYGAKLEQIIDLIKSIDSNEQVLLFVQFEDLMARISAALTKEGISNYAMTEANTGASTKEHWIDSFKFDTSKTKKKVLILNPSNESAAGVNLTNATHVVFTSPLLAPTQQHYEASWEQCVGRSRRYPQRKTVHIYRFLALKTIDVDILEKREGKRLVKQRDGAFVLKDDNSLSGAERNVHWGSGLGPLEIINETSEDDEY